MIKHRYLSLLLVYFILVSIWGAFGYFSIGALTDTYSDVFSAMTSSLWNKCVNAVPYIDVHRYRPFFFLFLQGITSLSLLLGFSVQNYVLIKLIIIIFYFGVGFVVYKILLEINDNYFNAFLAFLVTILYPNNLNSLFWMAGILELLVVILFLSALLFRIISVKTNESKYYIFSVFCFIFALFTKETALIYPFVGLIILFISFPREIIAKYHRQFLIDSLVLLIFLIIRFTVVLPQTEMGIISNITDMFPSVKAMGGILIKSCFSLILPFDYFQTLEGLSSFNLYIVFYILVTLTTLAVVFYKSSKKVVTISIIVFIISVLPFIIAGYMRPQLILLPFCLVIITLSAQDIKISKFLLFILITLWIYEGIKIERYWDLAYNKFQRTIELLSKIDTGDKTTVVAGVPSRIKQHYIADNIMFPFNLKKYGAFVIRDTLIDIPRLVYLSTEAIEKEITITKKGKDNYLLSCPDRNLFFYFPDEETRTQKDVFEDNFLKMTIIERNEYSKPSQVLLELKRSDLKYFFMQPDRIINLR
ncbi:MAG: hypothetical protein ACP5P3_00165 [Ignavibacteria bacterium]